MHCRGTSSLSHFLRNLSIEAQTHCTTQPGPSKVSSNKKSCKSHTWGKRRCWDLLKLPAGWAVSTYPRGWQNSAVPLPIIPQHLAPSGLQFQPFILKFYLFFPLFFFVKRQSFVPSSAPVKAWCSSRFKLGAQKVDSAQFCIGEGKSIPAWGRIRGCPLGPESELFSRVMATIEGFCFKSQAEKRITTSSPAQWSLPRRPGKAEISNYIRHRQEAANNKHHR